MIGWVREQWRRAGTRDFVNRPTGWLILFTLARTQWTRPVIFYGYLWTLRWRRWYARHPLERQQALERSSQVEAEAAAAGDWPAAILQRNYRRDVLGEG
jgi:hypothetical protein